MTDQQREAFEKWASDFVIIIDNGIVIKTNIDDMDWDDIAFAAWQAAIAQKSEPVAWMLNDPPQLYGTVSAIKTRNDEWGFTIPLYTSPPNTFTKEEVREKCLDCLEIASDDAMHRDGVLLYDTEAIVDKVIGER